MDFPIKDGDFPLLCKRSPEGTAMKMSGQTGRVLRRYSLFTLIDDVCLCHAQSTIFRAKASRKGVIVVGRDWTIFDNHMDTKYCTYWIILDSLNSELFARLGTGGKLAYIGQGAYRARKTKRNV